MRRALVLLVAALTAGELGAQALRPTGSASLVTARVRSAVPAGIDQFTGSAFLGQGALAMGRVELSFSYLQGTLNPDGGSAGGRDLVEGTVLLGVPALHLLTLEGGPHARAYTLAGSTQRWLFWELRARGATAVVGSAGRGEAGRWGAPPAGGERPGAAAHDAGGGG